MKLTARTVTQDGAIFYETAIPALEIIDDSLFRPDRWNPVNNEGYQRELSQEHSRRIQQYLQGGGGTNVLPTNVIINSRKPLNVKQLGSGLVEIEVSSFPLFIVDGQHRITALRQAEENGSVDLTHYELGVTLTNFNLRDEMIHFRNINGRTNRPPKALSDLLMGTLAERYGLVPASLSDQALIRVNRVVTRLATDIESPWYGKVALGGTRRRGYHLTTQSAFAQSMLNMFTNGRFSDPEENNDKIYQIFKDFWTAVAEVWPAAAENPTQYQLMRPIGLAVWHKILGRILTNLAFSPNHEVFVAALQKLREDLNWDDAWWALKNYEGAYGMVLARGAVGSQDRGNVITETLWKTLDKDYVRELNAASMAEVESR